MACAPSWSARHRWADGDQQARVTALSASYATVARSASVPYVDVAEPLIAAGTWLEEVQRGDGAHPGAEGYAELARLLLDGGWLGWLLAARTR